MNANIIKWIKGEVNEFTNAQYIAEVMSSPTEKYKHMEANFASALLHAMSFMNEEITGEPLPLDELFPAMANDLLFREGSYESIEFIRSIMDNYEQELEKYKAIRSGEITKEMRLSAEIDGMNKDELIVAIAKAQGISVYDYEWPCYIHEGELFAASSKDTVVVNKTAAVGMTELATAGNLVKDMVPRPVTCLGGCGVEEKPVLEPLVNYPDDITHALYLVSDLKSQGFALSTKESIAKGTYTCSFSRQQPYETLVSGYSRSLPEAICKAYLKVMLFEINTDAIGRVFDGDNETTTSSVNVEEVTTA